MEEKFEIIDLLDGGINILCGYRSNILNKKEHSDIISAVKRLSGQLQAYKEDRFCQGGCAVYQYDKLRKQTEQLNIMEEALNKVKINTSKEIKGCSLKIYSPECKNAFCLNRNGCQNYETVQQALVKIGELKSHED